MNFLIGLWPLMILYLLELMALRAYGQIANPSRRCCGLAMCWVIQRTRLLSSAAWFPATFFILFLFGFHFHSVSPCFQCCVCTYAWGPRCKVTTVPTSWCVPVA